jgi:metal-sulfur cluster biosynthetic enzyme
MRQIELTLWEKLKEVIDPGANLSVVDMGLIKELSISHSGQVNIVLRPSSPVCPLAFALAANIKQVVSELSEVNDVHLKIVDFVRADELNRMMEET